MMKILVLNGPNLNLLGNREKKHYGSDTLDQIREQVQKTFPNIQTEWFQSNHEGELIDRIHNARKSGFQGIVANWGGYTHTSVAIRDALEPVKLPKIEVHLSNIHGREEFRKTSLTGEVVNGIITGFGADSYLLGIQAVKYILDRQGSGREE